MKLETKEIYISAHIREITQKPHRFVCRCCNKLTERATYPPSVPRYCVACRPPKVKKNGTKRISTKR